jgi:hypothetical protein
MSPAVVPGARPRSIAAAVWGVGGTVVILLDAVIRLGHTAITILGRETIGAGHAVFGAAWLFFIVYVEGYRAFQKRFSPRVVARAFYLAEHPRPLHVALAPIYVMALMHTTRRRLIASWILVAGIVGVVLLVRALPPVWRALIDAGVALALAWGTIVMVVYFVRGLAGHPMPVGPDLPEDDVARGARTASSAESSR